MITASNSVWKGNESLWIGTDHSTVVVFYKQLPAVKNVILVRHGHRGIPRHNVIVFYHLRGTAWFWVLCAVSFFTSYHSSYSMLCSPGTPNIMSTISAGWESICWALCVCGSLRVMTRLVPLSSVHFTDEQKLKFVLSDFHFS